jgi:hypothetical protein
MTASAPPTAKDRRLADARERGVPWRRWGPYVSERQWGTVREDYSAGGDAWNDLGHDQSRSRAYRWGEDGISDDQQRLCFALALWNGQDPILKERLFGLTGAEGNHGEDVKEYYFHLDNTPTHAYVKYLYKYPQRAYPYEQLLQENRRRSRLEPEYELLDTGVFDDDRCFDVFVEYAKDGPHEMRVRISAVNRGPGAAPLHLLPTLWCRNTRRWTTTCWTSTRPRRCCSPRTRATAPGCGAGRQAAMRRMPSTTKWCTGAATPSTRPGSAPRPRRCTGARRRRARPGCCGCAWLRRRPPMPVRRATWARASMR